MPNDSSQGGGPASFLLAQIGSHAASKFAERLAPLGFAPYHAGILRILDHRPGISQQDLAAALDMHASRLVAVIDELEKKGLVARRSSERDRRLYELHLTPQGNESLRKIGETAREHHQALMAGLSSTEQQELRELLEKIAQNQGLRRGVHPGYRQLGARRPSPPKTPEG